MAEPRVIQALLLVVLVWHIVVRWVYMFATGLAGST